jgi:hypothetical protein
VSYEFWTKLIKVSEYYGDSIPANCTHVKGDYWIFEGDEEFISGKFEVLAEGAAPSLGGLSEKELIEICAHVFGVQIENATTLPQEKEDD